MFFDIFSNRYEEDIFLLAVIVCLASISIFYNPLQSAIGSLLYYPFLLLSLYFYAMIAFLMKTQSIIKILFFFIIAFICLQFLFESG